MSEMVERVAIAINEAVFGKAMDADPRSLMMARAAIEAMREPTKAMIKDMAKAMSPAKRPTPDRVSVSDKHRIRYIAAIDAALRQD